MIFRRIAIFVPKEKLFAQHWRIIFRNEKLSTDVDLAELAHMTKNFSGAEIEGLVRAAQSCALNRLVKASSKVQTIFIPSNILEYISFVSKIVNSDKMLGKQ